MIIVNNDTCWNLIYLFIMRGLKFKMKLQYYFMNNKKELNVNYLKKIDWKIL